MTYTIRMGVPEMAELWSRLQNDYRDGTICKQDRGLYKKWGAALKKLATDPHYPSLNSHEIEVLSKRYELKHFFIVPSLFSLAQSIAEPPAHRPYMRLRSYMRRHF